jgi:predicted enzyme related to lactoylglutathione lyase
MSMLSAKPIAFRETIREEVLMPPTLANGKICYVEMPASDVTRSADFYTKVFGWTTRKRGDGHTAFDDGVGQVTLDAIVANGGEVVQPIGADAPEITARFRDPAGNVIGLYQQPG